MGIAISVNGKLMSVYDQFSSSEERCDGYTQIQIGKPLLIRYLNFFLNFNTQEKKNRLMISTFIKTKETKEASAEAINYFNPKVNFENNELTISTLGAEFYGHFLIYYTKSYLGESIYLTNKVMELDKINVKTRNAIKNGLSTLSSLPSFAEFLPYISGINIGISLFSNIINFFNKDDPIIEGFNLDLIFNLNNVCRLQSGRFVCVQSLSSAELTSNDKYSLSKDNKLIHNDTKQEYKNSSYFVIQVDSKNNRRYENFDYFLGAADLLKQTNRRNNQVENINSVVEILKSYNDIKAIHEIEKLSIDSKNEEIKKYIRAYYNSMSNEIQPIYKDKVRELISS